MIYLRLDDLHKIAERVIGSVVVRDIGLLESALVRPQASHFGVDAYPTPEEKAGALLHSLVGNHALIDGNKRLGLAAMIAFLGMNGRRLAMTNDAAYDVVMAVATRELDEVAAIADILRAATEPR